MGEISGKLAAFFGDPRKFSLKTALTLIFVVQSSIIVYFNLALLKIHPGYDFSWALLRTTLIWREKSIFDGPWIEQTNILLDSSVSLAALLFGITGNIFLSYGISNLIILSGILVLLNRLTSFMNFSPVTRLLCLNLVVCPYIGGSYFQWHDLGYFSDLLGAGAFYNVRILTFLLIMYNFLAFERGVAGKWLPAFSLALCFLCGLSSGIFIVVMIIFPIAVFLLERCIVENDFGRLKSKETLYAGLCTVAVLAGKFFAKFMGAEAIDSTRTWTALENIYTNFGAVLQGCLKLLRVLPVNKSDVMIISKDGFFTILALFIFLALTAAFAYCLRLAAKNISACDKTMLFALNVPICHFAIFGLFNVTYGEQLFEERYLMCAFMAVVLLTGHFAENLPKGHVGTRLFACCLTLCLLGTDYRADSAYIKSNKNSWEMSEIKETVQQYDAPLVYFWTEDGAANWWHSRVVGRAMRVYDLDHVYKTVDDEGPGGAPSMHRWGDYTFLDEGYSGPTMLVTEKNAHGKLPPAVFDSYKKVRELDGWEIFISEENPPALKVCGTGRGEVF